MSQQRLILLIASALGIFSLFYPGRYCHFTNGNGQWFAWQRMAGDGLFGYCRCCPLLPESAGNTWQKASSYHMPVGWYLALRSCWFSGWFSGGEAREDIGMLLTYLPGLYHYPGNLFFYRPTDTGPVQDKIWVHWCCGGAGTTALFNYPNSLNFGNQETGYTENSTDEEYSWGSEKSIPGKYWMKPCMRIHSGNSISGGMEGWPVRSMRWMRWLWQPPELTVAIREDRLIERIFRWRLRFLPTIKAGRESRWTANPMPASYFLEGTGKGRWGSRAGWKRSVRLTAMHISSAGLWKARSAPGRRRKAGWSHPGDHWRKCQKHDGQVFRWRTCSTAALGRLPGKPDTMGVWRDAQSRLRQDSICLGIGDLAQATVGAIKMPALQVKVPASDKWEVILFFLAAAFDGFAFYFGRSCFTQQRFFLFGFDITRPINRLF